MSDENQEASAKEPQRRFGCLQVLGLLVIAVVVTALLTVWVTKSYLFPGQFKPVSLNEQEERALAAKLDNLEYLGADDAPGPATKSLPGNDAPLQPEAYTEEGAERGISFSERELNALLAKNTDLARKVAVDLSDNLISARLRFPMDEDFPVLGGKILRAKTGLGFAYEDGKPVVVLKGVTIMGVPVPNAWLGGLKNIDLVQEFGAEEGFWQTFAAGIAAINVEEGRLRIQFKE